jgi:hypothetical protein
MSKLIEALGVTYAAIGQEVSDATLQIVAMDLGSGNENEVLESLARCRRELRRMSLVDILERLPSGHPGPEEAWAIVAPALNDESVTIVETDQIAEAFAVALNLADNPIAARMAFLERYRTAVREARRVGAKARWWPCLGADPTQRNAPLLEAERLGRLPTRQVRALLAQPKTDGAIVRQLKIGVICQG